MSDQFQPASERFLWAAVPVAAGRVRRLQFPYLEHDGRRPGMRRQFVVRGRTNDSRYDADGVRYRQRRVPQPIPLRPDTRRASPLDAGSSPSRSEQALLHFRAARRRHQSDHRGCGRPGDRCKRSDPAVRPGARLPDRSLLCDGRIRHVRPQYGRPSDPAAIRRQSQSDRSGGHHRARRDAAAPGANRRVRV